MCIYIYTYTYIYIYIYICILNHIDVWFINHHKPSISFCSSHHKPKAPWRSTRSSCHWGRSRKGEVPSHRSPPPADRRHRDAWTNSWVDGKYSPKKEITHTYIHTHTERERYIYISKKNTHLHIYIYICIYNTNLSIFVYTYIYICVCVYKSDYMCEYMIMVGV